MLSFLRFCRVASLFIVASLTVVTAVADGKPNPSKKLLGKGYFAEPPPSSQIEVGREITITGYGRAKNSSGDYCQLNSAKVTFLEKTDEYAVLHVKTSGNIANGLTQACVDGAKVAMALAEFNNILRDAEAKAQRSNQAEAAKKRLEELLK